MSEPARQLAALRLRPRLSVVVAWQGSSVELSRWLRAWVSQLDERAEVIVVAACVDADRQRIERAHPGVQLIGAPIDSELAARRQLGVSSATGDIVVILDDAIGTRMPWRGRLPSAIGGVRTPVDSEWARLQSDGRAADVALR
jgi:hypothetical protein